MITQLELKNFMAFSDLNINFSPGINIIIGENSTGKTQLLKASYALYSGATLLKNQTNISDDKLAEALTTKLTTLFMPLDGKLRKMHHQGATKQAYLQARFAQDQEIAATFFKNSNTVVIKNRNNYQQYQAKTVFIPTKEVLASMEGFNSLYEKYELSFDQTYQDICLLLDLPKIRPEALHKESKQAMAQIKDICGGYFVFHGGGKVTFKSESAEFSANAMAEGFRKIGMLWRLLETGAIHPGVSGPLFWDEPESNLNPKLIQLLAQILLELSRNNQQIILTTNDYVLLKWFDLLIDKNKDDHILFHTLYRDNNGVININSAENYQSITPNAIADTFNDMTRKQVNKMMGRMGK